MAVKKQRSQVAMSADEIRASYAQQPTEQLTHLLTLLAPHTSNESTREFFELVSNIVAERSAK